jgi:hypothetical protein
VNQEDFMRALVTTPQASLATTMPPPPSAPLATPPMQLPVAPPPTPQIQLPPLALPPGAAQPSPAAAPPPPAMPAPAVPPPAQPPPAAAPTVDFSIDPTTGAPVSFDPAAQLAAQRAAAEQLAAQRAALHGADTSSGAPAQVRLAVGSSDDPATRLARLKLYYPDAQPVPGTGNFVYTDPATQARRTYMPTGMRLPTPGDIASLAPEGAEVAGGLLGAAAGTAIGGPVVGTALGAGTGAVAAKEATERFIGRFLGMPDLRTPEQQVADAGITLGTNAVLPGVTDAAGRVVARGLLAPGTGTATQQAAGALDAAGVTTGLRGALPTGVAAESPGIQKTESALMQTPTAGVIADRYADTAAKLREGVDTLAGRNVVAPATVPTPDTFANTVQSIANDIKTDAVAQGTARKDTVNNLLGAQPVDFANLRSTLAMLNARRGVAAESMGPSVFDDAINQGNAILNDAAKRGGSLPFANVLQQRTLAGAMPDWLSEGGASALQDNPVKQLYGAVRQDLYDAASAQGAATGSNAGIKALNDYDSYWRNWMNGPKGTIDALTADTTKANTIQSLMTQTTPKAQMDMANLWRLASPEQQGVIQAGVLKTMGDTPDGFNMATFNTNWGKLNQPQRDLVFGSGAGSLGDSLNNLSTVQSSIRNAGTTRGHSNTGAVTYMLLSGLEGLGHAADLQFGTAAKKVGTALGGPWAAARLLQSRPFVNAVTGSWGLDPSVAGNLGRAAGAVAVAGAADPGITDLTNQYLQGLPREPPGLAPPPSPPQQPAQ